MSLCESGIIGRVIGLRLRQGFEESVGVCRRECLVLIWVTETARKANEGVLGRRLKLLNGGGQV